MIGIHLQTSFDLHMSDKYAAHSLQHASDGICEVQNTWPYARIQDTVPLPELGMKISSIPIQQRNFDDYGWKLPQIVPWSFRPRRNASTIRGSALVTEQNQPLEEYNAICISNTERNCWGLLSVAAEYLVLVTPVTSLSRFERYNSVGSTTELSSRKVTSPKTYLQLASLEPLLFSDYDLTRLLQSRWPDP
ncbi:hypothetical protein EX30DRAFT_47319 [Ascodesmis nigricans]|uniref:Uncharacterized protein n=1 Tax=Ascodesmis nigricans TaxID=341454 RepID=A0A4S2MVU9_9PEZI|nr:hypothetical protein EX30DRAFT_47319 [Ascodesmis nigricans]